MSHCNSCFANERTHTCLICDKKLCKDCVINLICKNCLALYIEKQIDKQLDNSYILG